MSLYWTREMLSFSFLENETGSVCDRGGGWLWARMCTNCIHMLSVLCSLSWRFYTTFPPYNPQSEPLSSLPCVFPFTPSSPPPLRLDFSTSLLCFPSFPPFSPHLFFFVSVSVYLVKMDGLQKLDGKSGRDSVVAFQLQQKQTVIRRSCQQRLLIYIQS